jgi:hypothetical protein
LDAKDVDDLLSLLSVRDRKSLNITLQRELEKLERSRIPTVDKAKEIAIGHKLKSGGVLAEERAKVIGLIRLGVDVPDFARASDLIWIVRFAHLSRGITQEMWINSTTAKVRATLSVPEKPRK